jgi:hypothetical protein
MLLNSIGLHNIMKAVSIKREKGEPVMGRSSSKHGMNKEGESEE